MKNLNSTFVRIASLLAAMCLLTCSALAQTEAQKAFAAIKNMPGTWEQTSADGQTLHVTFKTVSGGSAVVSEIEGKGSENMITMIHLDGPDRILMTHYCSIGNQPRMVGTVSKDGKTITFNYLDGTNLAAPDAGHMQKMILTLVAGDHHTEEWVFVDQGKERKEVFDLRRKM